MYLVDAELWGIAPFGHIELSFGGVDDEPRMVTVVLGTGGVGKTALLYSLATTRPGHAVVPTGRTSIGPEVPAHALCRWVLGDDDPTRPHPLAVSTPNLRPPEEPEHTAVMRRREQALFDKQARANGGFVFLTISSARWFSRQAVTLTAPLRTVARYDGIRERLLPTLREHLPTVQWIVTTASALVAASVEPDSVLALRRSPEQDHVELYTGAQALVH